MSDGKAIEYVDAGLVRRSKDGDIDAFEELFNRYQKRVYNIVYGVVCNENDAAELTQDVFVKVFRTIGGLNAEEAFLTWVRTVALNICRDHLRKHRRVRVESLDEKLSIDGDELDRDIPDSSNDPAGKIEAKHTRQAVCRAIDSLSDEHRTVVALHHIEGMDVKDIAKLLGCPVGTVKSRLARARDELRRKLAAYA
ncbi:MAG: sigma-70 family RNA polymerase sigma factor [Armatimonadota bacterium]|nr:sigma-70 family RNA polymerase sigma factor [Armatimonadota bacterium]